MCKKQNFVMKTQYLQILYISFIAIVLSAIYTLTKDFMFTTFMAPRDDCTSRTGHTPRICYIEILMNWTILEADLSHRRLVRSLNISQLVLKHCGHKNPCVMYLYFRFPSAYDVLRVH